MKQGPVDFTIRIVGAEEMNRIFQRTEDDFHFLGAKDVTPVVDRTRLLRAMMDNGIRAKLETTARRI